MTSSTVVGRATSKTQSVSDALSSGTRTARPFSLPSSSGKISPIAVADPVVVGISETLAARALRRSLCGASMSVCVLVMSCSVVISPCRIPIPSWITFTTGARQLVVHDAAVSRSWRSRLVEVVVDADDEVQRARSLTGAATITLRTPCSKYGSSELPRAEPARALEHDLDAELAPRHIAGLGGAAVAERRPVDRQHVAVAVHVLGPAPVDRVERQQMRGGLGVAVELVDVHERELGPVPRRTQRQAPHATEAVDPDPTLIEQPRVARSP